MLSKIIIKNYRSFRETTIIDLEATNYKMLQDTNTKDGIVKGLMFIGGNGTGKTNAIFAIRTLLDMLFKEIDITSEFCFFSKDKKMLLEYHFKQDNDFIKYHIEINKPDGKIEKETLSLNNEIILDRLLSSAKTSLSEKTLYEKEDIDSKTLFLKTLYFYTKFSSNQKIKKWYTFLQNSIYFNSVDKSFIPYNDKETNLKIRDYLANYGALDINKFFQSFGFDQELTFDSKHEISPACSMVFVDANNQEYKEIFVKRNNMNLWIPYHFESLGNKTLLNLLPLLLYMVKNDGLFIIDEFSSAFHNELEELVIKYFMKKSSYSQLFFVSHSTNLLKSTLLRPDQIYTISFYNELGSTIYRVSQEHPRESQNLEKMYLNNIFKGMPKYNFYDQN